MNSMKLHLERKVSNSYEIHIGRDILDRVGPILARNNWARQYVLITDTTVGALHGDRVQSALEKGDLKVRRIEIPPGETAKAMATALDLTERLLALGADRHTALIALGGGVVGDLAGFVASIYMRGVPCIQIPTTLLAQVDSSIGGKTGVDVAAGKNLLGTFYQPRGVFIDVDFLQTLPGEALRSGLAEVIKYGIIESPDLLTRIEDHAGAIGAGDPAFLEEIIAASCRIKKGIVELDEREKGLRRILNFGHTVGHAVEAASSFTIPHGEAVAMGMVAAAVLSERLHYLPPEEGRRIESVIRTAGLPVKIPGGIDTEEILGGLKKDKKKEGDKIHFVLLKKIGIPFMNGGVPEKLVRETIEGLKR